MEKESQVWREDAELSFELAELEGWPSGEIQVQDTNQWSLAHKWELKLWVRRAEQKAESWRKLAFKRQKEEKSPQ